MSQCHKALWILEAALLFISHFSPTPFTTSPLFLLPVNSLEFYSETLNGFFHLTWDILKTLSGLAYVGAGPKASWLGGGSQQ